MKYILRSYTNISIPLQLCIYLSFLTCGQPDDDHVRSKHVADLWNKHIVVFWLYKASQELMSLLQDLIPELILIQKHHIHMGPIHIGSGVMSF